MLPDCLWKRKWNVTSCSWKAKLATLHRATSPSSAKKYQLALFTEKNYLTSLFTFVRGVEGDRQRRPLLQLKTKRLMLPVRRWKRLLQLYKCKGHANGSTLPTANKMPVCRSLIIYKRRGRRGNVALFCS